MVDDPPHHGSPAQRYTFAGEIFKKPFEIERTEGVYLFTPDGTAILDAAGGAIVVNIGHGRRIPGTVQTELQTKRESESAAEPGKILIVRLGSLGDIFHTLPAQQQIHRRFPKTEFHWLVEPHYLPHIHPCLLRIVLDKTRLYSFQIGE